MSRNFFNHRDAGKQMYKSGSNDNESERWKSILEMGNVSGKKKFERKWNELNVLAVKNRIINFMSLCILLFVCRSDDLT